ncbi:MAG: glycosidase [Calditrichia bacterium]
MGEFKLKRVNDVILDPDPSHDWESGAVFNPGTVAEGETVHMLYRAVTGENKSTIGYAQLSPEGKVIKRYHHPVIVQEFDREQWGCEDPRIVPFGGRYLIFYTGFDGKDIIRGENARIMLAETRDFSKFHKYGMIGPDVQDKDAMIFPEEIGGKIAFIHRVVPNIQIAFFDDLNHLIQPEKTYWDRHLRELDRFTVMCRETAWEALKIGAGPPPIRTEAGWLLIYHGVDEQKVYRAGAALLDEKNPLRVIARLPYPILEPEREYEKIGDVNMVVFPEGVVQFDNEIFVYYGAADKVIGLAAGNLSELIDALWKNKVR